MIYFFVLDDSLTSWRFATRTEQLTKCCEPLQKLRARLGTCKTSLSPPVILYYWSLQGDTSVMVVLCIGVEYFAVCTLCTFSSFFPSRFLEWELLSDCAFS